MNATFPAMERVRAACERELAGVRAEGLAAPALHGQLIRPLLSHAGAQGGHAGAASPASDTALWHAALAVQLAHEASLLHDDVIDAAARRRGEPTVVSARGVAAALVEGDHLLTTGYRLAARTGSLAFVELYARAVERTVAGEREQHVRRGQALTLEQYYDIVLGKSGELIGCAFAAAPVLRADPRALAFFEAGRRIGLCYQLVDDLLDYCAGADNGKSAFGDWSQRLWTWPLLLLPGATWPQTEAELRAVLVRPDVDGRAPLERALDWLRATFAPVRAEVQRLVPGERIVDALFEDWLTRAAAGVTGTLALLQATAAAPNGGDHSPLAAAAPGPTAPDEVTPQLPGVRELDAFFAQNSRSFSFAARLFPPAERARVADVYAFCRVTDDLVDGDDALPASVRAARLDAWHALCRRAWEHGDTGIPTLDRVLRTAAGAGVPFACVEDLIAGMRMDLVKDRYTSLAELRTYTHRVASVVGLWLTHLWGVHDRDVLARAADLGHAMQLTNILRDVGEDWRAGRLYLPEDLMRRHRVDEALLAGMVEGAPITARYRALLEELMAVADAYYARAFEAIPALPPHARRAVAAAAAVYRGIHDEIRAHRYDNLTRRARTSRLRKLQLAAGALARLGWRSTPRAAAVRVAATATLVFALLFAWSAGVRAQAGTEAHLSKVEARVALAPEDSLLQLERVRALYFVAVEQERRLEPARTALAQLRADYTGMAAAQAPLLLAYEGALELLRAKHGTWPLARWQATRRGLRQLDAAVAAAPAHPEVRYLRLISCYYLPGIFGRGDSVREDFDALATLLPTVSGDYPREFMRDVARFVLAHAELDARSRERLLAWEGSDD